MSVEETVVPTLKRQYPHVDDIADWRAQQSIRLLWDRVFDLEARLRAVEATQGDLVTATNQQEDQLARVQVAAGEALAIAQGKGGSLPGEGEPELPSTIPNYYSIVQAALAKYVSPVVPFADREAGKAQLTRLAAWDIYQVDDRIRLLEKLGGNQINGRSTDVVVQGTDGSFADVSTYKDNGDGTVTIKATWTDHGPDANTSDESRWIVPTAAIAAEPGPMTPI